MKYFCLQEQVPSTNKYQVLDILNQVPSTNTLLDHNPGHEVDYFQMKYFASQLSYPITLVALHDSYGNFYHWEKKSRANQNVECESCPEYSICTI